jgi:hypothetical protein
MHYLYLVPIGLLLLLLWYRQRKKEASISFVIKKHNNLFMLDILPIWIKEKKSMPNLQNMENTPIGCLIKKNIPSKKTPCPLLL